MVITNSEKCFGHLLNENLFDHFIFYRSYHCFVILTLFCSACKLYYKIVTDLQLHKSFVELSPALSDAGARSHLSLARWVSDPNSFVLFIIPIVLIVLAMLED